VAEPATVARRPRPQLSDESAGYIRDMIISGRLQPGAFIRQERIAEELGVSATPVREGLLQLRGEGFVRLEPRRGFVVAPLTGKDVMDMFQAQGLVAGELAARCVPNASSDDLRELERLQARLDALMADGAYDDMEVVNHLFHRQVNSIAASPKMAWLLSVGARYVPRRFYSTIGGWPAASQHDHRSIIHAIATRDADAARTAMEHHFVHAGELLAQHRERAAAQRAADASAD
jgi:DNA-binding GntR family transcriptional regulator